MRFSTRSQYGLRALAYLALNRQRPVSLKEISQAENISFYYLEKILLKLRKSGFINSQKGAHGGYFLNGSPRKIKIGAVIESLEGKMAVVKCIGGKFTCPQAKKCLTRGLWQKIQKTVITSLDSFTLNDLISDKQ
ncbi:MAG: Rrf2 family transcriptional regulator [bacterium]